MMVPLIRGLGLRALFQTSHQNVDQKGAVRLDMGRVEDPRRRVKHGLL